MSYLALRPVIRAPLTILIVMTCLACSAGPAARPSEAPPETQPEAPRESLPLTSSSTAAISHYRAARREAESLRNSDAFKLYAAAAKADPSFALAFLGMAETAPTASESFVAMRRAVELADGASAAERHLIFGLQAGFNGDPMQQRKHYQKLLEEYPSDPGMHTLLAPVLLRLGEHEEAIRHLEAALALVPTHASAYNLLGYAYSATNRPLEAAHSFQRLIELLPEEPNPYDSYAELLLSQGRYDEAIANYEQALARDPDFFFSRMGIGDALLLAGRHAEARAAFQVAYERVSTDGQRRQALFGQVVSYFDEGEVDHALEVMEQRYALAEGTDDRVAMSDDLLVLGEILMELGKPELAAERFHQALEMLEKSAASVALREAGRRSHPYHMARVMLARGDLAAARSLAEQFERTTHEGREPTPLEAARGHELRGRLALASEDYETALRELGQGDPEDPRVLYYRALALWKTGDEVGAQSLARHILEIRRPNLAHSYVQARVHELLNLARQR